MSTMTPIDSDTVFRAALSELPVDQQRQVAKLFVDHVMDLTDSAKVRQAMVFADANMPSVEADLADGYKAAKAAAIESYTLCGNEGDWRNQAGHFVAAAAVACLTPGPQAGRAGSVAWSTAMNARMARVCKKIADGQGADDTEAKEQYLILESFLKAG